MAWVAKDKNKSEHIFSKPPQRAYDYFGIRFDDRYNINDYSYWVCETDATENMSISVPKGTIKRLIDKNLTWGNNPVELTDELYKKIIF